MKAIIVLFALTGFATQANVLTTKHLKVAHAHAHQHGPNCGHKAEKHGDHTDYEEVVNGSLHHHKLDGDHYDECTGPEGKKS
jgi:zinc transport system permease protein